MNSPTQNPSAQDTSPNAGYPAPARLVIATRESRLALWQAHHVRDRLLQLYPGCTVDVLGMTTRGDQILDRPLAKVGGKGLFVKELETALLDGKADLAVHSMKDVPMVLPPEFALVATGEREVPLDAFVSPKYDSLADLPPGAVVGTSSLRREAQLRARYPYLSVSALRGNLDTRLRKLDEGQYDAIILAAAGLKRLGLENRIRGHIAAEDSLPAAGQGALGIEALASRPDVAAWLAPLNHPDTQACVRAEREVARLLAGSCDVPLGAFANMQADGQMRLRGLIALPDGTRMIQAEITGMPEQAEQMGQYIASQLRSQGAEEILAQLQNPLQAGA